MDAAATLARLHRRAGFGLTPADLDAAIARGVDTEIARLVSPASAGVAPAADAWAGVDLTYDKGQAAATAVTLADGWLNRMIATPRPLEERMAWFWHGHFVSALSKVRYPVSMVTQIRLFQQRGLGSFVDLVRAVTVDPAMLIYLDGTTSTGTHPNENYGRELLELFTLGRGNYTEADVQAGAAALTGWHVVRTDLSQSAFTTARHDPTPQRYLGTTGVHDADTVVATVTSHPACAPFVAGKIARAVIGPDVSASTVASLASTFARSGLSVAALVSATLHELARGTDGGAVVTDPVTWLVMAQRATAAPLDAKVRASALRAAGQLPLYPPNVGGWPGGGAWYGTATVVARFDLASAIANAAPAANAAVQAAAAADSAALSRALGLPAPFGAETSAALAKVADAPSRLVIALTSPEFVLA